MNGGRGWYVIEAYDGRDKEVYNRLAALGWKVWRPVYVVRVHRRRGGCDERKRDYRPVFGRYLFLNCLMTDSVVPAIREVRDVFGFLCQAGTEAPWRVPDALIAEYQQESASPLFAKDKYGVGDLVSIIDGVYSDHVVRVTAVDSDGVLKVAIALFGTVIDVPMRPSRVKLVERAQHRKRA